jgi:hypothetical protein
MFPNSPQCTGSRENVQGKSMEQGYLLHRNISQLSLALEQNKTRTLYRLGGGMFSKLNSPFQNGSQV